MPEVELHHDGYPAYRRKVRFDWSDTPLHWVPDDPFATHMMNVLHLVLPEGERLRRRLRAARRRGAAGSGGRHGAGLWQR